MLHVHIHIVHSDQTTKGILNSIGLIYIHIPVVVHTKSTKPNRINSCSKKKKKGRNSWSFSLSFFRKKLTSRRTSAGRSSGTVDTQVTAIRFFLSRKWEAAGFRGGRRRCYRPGAAEGDSPPRNAQAVPVLPG